MDDQYKLILEIHGMIKKLEGRFDSLNCTKNEREMYCIRIDQQNLEKKLNAMPSKAWGFILGIIMMILTGISVYANIIKG